MKHFIRIDSKNNIIKGFSNVFEQPIDGDICINEDAGRHFELDGQINPQLINEHGIYMFKYIDNGIVEKTPEEIQQEIGALPPAPKSEIEILREENSDLKTRLELAEGAIDFIIMNGLPI